MGVAKGRWSEIFGEREKTARNAVYQNTGGRRKNKVESSQQTL